MQCIRCKILTGEATTPTAPIPGRLCGRCREEDRIRASNFWTSLVVSVCCTTVIVVLGIRGGLVERPAAPPPPPAPPPAIQREPLQVLPEPDRDGAQPAQPEEPRHEEHQGGIHV